MLTTDLMKTWLCRICALLVAFSSTDTFGQSDHSKVQAESIQRALSFLSREVPQWSIENNCYSCHNNGDAARALYTAARLGFRVDRGALADTTDWLTRPDRWRHNRDDGELGGKKLAAIQFSFALLDMMETDAVDEKAPLLQAAKTVAEYQHADGSWRIVADGTVGSPITYGTFLATAISLRVLTSADRKRFKPHIEKADSWLRTHRPKTVLDAAATLIGLGTSKDHAAVRQRRLCVGLIQEAQDRSGGWGPFVISAPEPFDTAVVLLGLSQLGDDAKRRQMIQRGHRYLMEGQFDDGSWPETTRPANAESYAQRIATTGWATLALLATMTQESHQ
ncbi:MAG: hypothetical protein CMJ50_06170 [Planctomycetaceae bacterium]|nr:hypothetical protein [Planctomycetaceae bacterium]